MVFSRGHRPQGGRQQLFEGTTRKKGFHRFSLWCSAVYQMPMLEFSERVGKISTIGTHSTRKGASTHWLGVTEGPSPIQVFLRPGWSLGNVQDRYLFAGEVIVSTVQQLVIVTLQLSAYYYRQLWKSALWEICARIAARGCWLCSATEASNW